MVSKNKILEACKFEIEARISNTQTAIKSAQESANSEQKSTAGDKHDTARSMAQFEQEKLSKQLAEQLKLRALVSKIPVREDSTIVQIGSLVKCTNGLFFLGIGLGKIKVEGEDVFCISVSSPLGKEIFNKSENEEFTVNGRTFSILSIS